MATETVVSDQSAPSQEGEKEVQSEVKKIEAENVSPREKECVENPKPEESPSPEAPSFVPETKIEEKQIKSCVTEDVKDINAGEQPKAQDSAELVAPLAEPTKEVIECKPVETPPAEVQKQTIVAAPLAELTEEKIEDKPVEPPPVEEKKKTETPIVEASDKHIQEVAKEAAPEPDTASTLEPNVKIANSKTEEKPETEPAPKQEETKVELFEEKPEEPVKIVDVPESSPAKVVERKLEKTKELPAKVVEAIESKDVTDSEIKIKPEETSEPAPVIEQTEKAVPVEKVELTAEVEDIKLSKKEETSATRSLDQVKSEAPVTQGKEKDVECYPTDELSEKTGEGKELKEPAKETIEVKGLSEEKDVNPEKIEAEIKVPEAKTEEKTVVAEELVQCAEKPTEGATSSFPPPELAEKAAEVASRDIELVAENGNNKHKTVVSAETIKDADVGATKEPEKTEAAEKIDETVQTAEAKLQEEKQVDEKIEKTVQATEAELQGKKQVDEKIEKTVQATEAKLEEQKQVDEKMEKNVQATEPKFQGEKQVCEKIEETVQATEAKLEEEKQVGEPAKTDVQLSECIRDSEDTRTSQDAPKEDVPVKTHKQSIVKMVKQSLVKAKKAITGKSQNSKRQPLN